MKLRSDQSSMVRLPASAIFSKEGQTFVWVVDPLASTVSLRKVDVVMSDAGAR